MEVETSVAVGVEAEDIYASLRLGQMPAGDQPKERGLPTAEIREGEVLAGSACKMNENLAHIPAVGAYEQASGTLRKL